jgi:hypothetical protein
MLLSSQGVLRGINTKKQKVALNKLTQIIR